MSYNQGGHQIGHNPLGQQQQYPQHPQQPQYQQQHGIPQQQHHHQDPAPYPVLAPPPQAATPMYGVYVPQYTPLQDPSAYQASRRPTDLNAPDRFTNGAGGAGYFTQLTATIRRQLIQKRRMWTSCLLEVFLPALFVIGLLVISSVSGRDEYAPKSFSNPSGPLRMGEMIRSQVCYDPSNPNANEDLMALVGACSPSNSYFCLPRSEDVPIEGFCVNNTFEGALSLAATFINVETDVEIPNFDEYVMWKWIAVTVVPSDDNLFSARISQARQPGRIFVTPESATTRTFTDYMNTTHLLFKHTFGGFFETRDAAIPFIKSLSNEGKIWALYELIVDEPNYLKYSLSMNNSAMNPLSSGPRDETSVGLGDKDYARYTVSGALTLQKSINDYHAINTVGSADSDIYPTGPNSHLAITPMPLDDYVDDSFLQIAGQMAPFLLVLSFLYSVSQLSKRLVEEKEQRLREGTMIMGLGKAAFFTSWLFIYYVQMFITSIIMSIIAKVGITKQTNFFVIFFTFFLFTLSSVNLSALLSTFFNKSKIAALLVPLLYFVFAIPAFAIPQTTGAGVFHVLSFLCPMPFSVALNLIFTHEINNGLGWNMAGSSKDKPYNFGLCLFWFIFDFFLYGILLVYFDNVLPKDWGTTLHPCFCCCCSCVKRDRAGKGENLRSQDQDAIDNPRNHLTHATTFGVLQDYPSANRHSSVHINQLRKDFPGAHGKTNVAVDGMELRMFPDSITVFLGHNGAGKTTVMNMMTGMMNPTDGDVTIYGKSILTDMQAIRRDIGFCPQHNILWADLTCMEHLQYFARLKGYSGAEVDEEAIEMLRKVDLLDKKDVFSKNLSGGQKRKLSVAIAFMGKARLVLLDEPTAGMDVAARRHTWDVLKEMSKGRTILLTTHYMDEADLLGSRIAIMSKGSLHSYGTPMHLKNNLGSGYVMRIASTVPITDPSKILREVQRILPSATIKESKGQELSITLPKEGTRSFPAVIRALEEPQTKRALNISSVSVSVSSLEDVFLAIAEHEEMEGKTQAELDEEHALIHSAFDSLETVYTRLQEKNRAAAIESGDVEMGNVNGGKAPTMGATGSFERQFRGMIMKRINHGRRDYCALCLQIVAPLVCIIIAMGLGEIGAPSPKRYYWDNNGLYGEQDVDQTTATNNCPLINDYFDTDFVTIDRQSLATTSDFSEYLLSQFNTNGDRERMVSFSCNDTFDNNVLLVNVTGLASAPQAVNQFYRAKLRAHNGNPAATIEAAQWPFPFTEREQSQIDTISAVLVALFILIPFTFIPSTYVAFIVRERECKSKHLQFVSGASYIAYWLANFVFDLVSYLVTVGIAFIVFAIFDQQWTIGSADAGFGTFFLFLFYGLSAIGCAYLVSFLFDNHSTAQTIIMMVNFIIGFLLVLVMFFLREIESTEDAAEVIRYILLLVPPFALGDGLFGLVTANSLSSIEGTKSAFSTEVAGTNMIYMALLSVVFLALTMFIDHPSRQTRRELLNFKSNHTAPVVKEEDEDVAKERADVENGQRPDDVVQVQGLRKEFNLGGGKQKVAVQNVTFGVKPGEVFGFLGTNGAGKTTTMSMLTTEIHPTCGTGRIGGYDIVKDSDKTRRLIGYCPQFDAIMDLLTPAEHLRLFAALRGVDETEEVVDALIKSCALEKYRDIPAGQLSGGNKRKLSVAMSLIGGPSIVFLDEPSAGMDPHARRHLWDVIIFVSKHSSVVLTTHHLEEVDVLAHRVGIMDAGLLKCLGSLEHLKLKFGSGFELTIQVADNGFKSATDFIANKYPSAVLVEARQHRILYTLPFDSTDLASLFETIQRATDDGSVGINDYTVQQTSLEQVFMRISELSSEDNHVPVDGTPVAEGTAAIPVDESTESHRQRSSHVYTDSVFNSSRNRRAHSIDVNNQGL